MTRTRVGPNDTDLAVLGCLRRHAALIREQNATPSVWGATVAELAVCAELPHATVQSALDRLRAEGLVQKARRGYCEVKNG